MTEFMQGFLAGSCAVLLGFTLALVLVRLKRND